MSIAPFSFARAAQRGSVYGCFRMAVAVLGLTVGLGLAGASVAGAADASGNLPVQAPVSAGSVTHGHVFLYTAQDSVDVTSMLYISGGQTYVAHGDDSMAVVIDYTRGIVWDAFGTVIGYVDQSSIVPQSATDLK
jgi:hypothetical protein